MAVGWSLDRIFPLPHAADNSQHEINPDHLQHGYENCPEHSDCLSAKRIAASSMLGPPISAFLGSNRHAIPILEVHSSGCPG